MKQTIPILSDPKSDDPILLSSPPIPTSLSALRSGTRTAFKLPTPPARIRTVGVATHIAQPSPARPISIPRLLHNPKDAAQSLLLQRTETISAAIRKYHTSSDETNEYHHIWKNLSIRTLALFILQTLPLATFDLVIRIVTGLPVDWSHIQPTVQLSVDFNLLGTYLHVGRKDDDRPFQRGAYVGSAGSENEDTSCGKSGLIGLLRRIYVQHGSDNYRTSQLRKAANKGYKVEHYSMYDPSDTPFDHIYVALSMVMRGELRELLGQPSMKLEDPQQETEQRNIRLGVLKIAETTWLLSLGLFRYDTDLTRDLKHLALSHGILQRNRTFGLETATGSHQEILAAASAGGQKAKLVFGQGQGLPQGGEGSLTGYLRATKGEDYVKKVSYLFHHGILIGTR
jgi:hypothetical protein